MTGDFAADVRLLEDVHRLQQERLVNSQIRDEFFDFVPPREFREHWIEIVQRMTNLVD